MREDPAAVADEAADRADAKGRKRRCWGAYKLLGAVVRHFFGPCWRVLPKGLCALRWALSCALARRLGREVAAKAAKALLGFGVKGGHLQEIGHLGGDLFDHEGHALGVLLLGDLKVP